MLSLTLLVSAFAATTAATARSPQARTPVVAEATYDGHCFYPNPTSDFNLTAYLGRWYQVAGTLAPFTAGCKCIHADYALNSNGTVDVKNYCERNGTASSISGTATPVSPEAGYGESGVLRVRFPPQPAPECPGPNYIVQDIGAPADYGWSGSSFAIVQASNFSTLFVLSRDPQPGNASVNAWLERARSLGSDLSDVAPTDQTGCRYA